MATPRAQRIGIWIIAIVLMIGTLGSFLAIGLSSTNQKIDQAAYQKQYDEYMAQQRLDAQSNALSSEGFGGFSAQAFDSTSVTKLDVAVLKQGDGEIIKSTDSINSSYFGWLADGTIFDSSKKIGSDDAPITFPLSGVISGWTEGLTGVKVGSIVELTIPADKAYGSQGSSAIPADSPLKFIVEIHKIDNSSSTGA
jgi:FKBP-type peptidyl-prolyl cis-trans isomerase